MADLYKIALSVIKFTKIFGFFAFFHAIISKLNNFNLN